MSQFAPCNGKLKKKKNRLKWYLWYVVIYHYRFLFLSRWTSQRVSSSNTSSAPNTSSAVSIPLTMRATTRGRTRILRAARGRAGTGWLSSRAVIPASAVPEDLIAQVS